MTLARTFIFKILKKLQEGELEIYDYDGVHHFGMPSNPFLPRVKLEVRNPELYSALLFGGNVALGETYMKGYWTTNDLTALVRVLLRNQRLLERVDRGVSLFGRLLNWMAHQLKRNTLRGSQKNIQSHYDLSNDFFKTFLDPTLMYSAAIFPNDTASLEEASLYKLDRICQKLGLSPRDKVIEIGTGWGSFAIHAAENYGCEVVTTTISPQQYQLAQERIHAKKLGKKITLLQEDYRKIQGTYDKLVSIEMIEAVGHHYYNTFFACCGKLLKSDGQALIQAITIQDQSYEQAKHEVDFIKKYIFPGSCIPSLTALSTAMTAASDLRLYSLEDIGLHYAKTLACWRKNMLAHAENIKTLGFDDVFLRQFDYYFAYCEAGFSERYISNLQLHFLKPQALRAS